jgi:hypothetical protein
MIGIACVLAALGSFGYWWAFMYHTAIWVPITLLFRSGPADGTQEVLL